MTKHSQSWVVACAYGIPFILTLLILWLEHPLLLRKIEEMQIFLPTSQYFKECMLTPGGLLEWAGTWLTEFFYHPWAGAAVLAALLMSMQALISVAFRVPARWQMAVGVANAMFTLAPLMLGYAVFTLKSPGHAFIPALGVSVASLAFWAFRSLRQWWWQAALILLTCIVGYPLFGAYALLALLLFAIHSLMQRNWLMAGAAVVLGCAYPWAWFYLTDTIVMRSHIYTSILPRVLEGEAALLIPYFVVGLMLCILCVAMGRYSNEPKRPIATTVASLVILAAAYGATEVFTYRDANFRTTLALDRALQDGNWAKATNVAFSMQVPPTRLNVLLSDVALLRAGQAGDRMFTLPISDAAYATSEPRRATALRDASAPLLCLHFGRVNDAYRWSMESKVETGQKVELLKYMAKCALLNSETELAKKYLSTLALTRNYKDWAKRYMKIADNPELLDSDEELAAIKPLMKYRDHVGGDGGNVEAYLLQVTGNLRGGVPQLNELAILCGLITKDLKEVWPKLLAYSTTRPQLPRHLQEAAIMYCTFNEIDVDRYLSIDESVKAEFKGFSDLARANKNLTQERNAQIFKARYGRTYWYYYFFITNLSTL